MNYYIHVLLKQIMSYTNTLMCFSYSCSSQSDDVINEVKYSNKIMLPPSILQDLVDGNYETPYFFKVENTETNFGQYCGIQEFSSPPGVTHIPYHIMSGLGINEGDNIKISLVTPTDGSYIKLQPHATAFTEINDPKGLLERMLSKNYPILTEGHTITIEDKETNHVFHIDIVKTEPAPVIKIIDVNVNVDFAPPLDYVPPKPVENNFVDTSNNIVEYDTERFPGKGHRLGEK